MSGKVILGVIGVVAIMAVCAAIFRQFWFALIAGGPLVLGIVVIAIFLFGVLLGSMLKS